MTHLDLPNTKHGVKGVDLSVPRLRTVGHSYWCHFPMSLSVEMSETYTQKPTTHFTSLCKANDTDVFFNGALDHRIWLIIRVLKTIGSDFRASESSDLQLRHQPTPEPRRGRPERYANESNPIRLEGVSYHR